MDARTCAACDSDLEGPAIAVSVNGQCVEVCGAACALALGEAQAAVEEDLAPRASEFRRGHVGWKRRRASSGA
ncbi:MAG: hypothetical protein JF588_11660 [Caulobacterales bacterium]|nr:hypothetical protein [Caulobacterales bacterium]